MLRNDLIDIYAKEVGVYGVAVFNVLARYADKNGRDSFPSYKTIADTLRISRRKAIDTVNLLEAKGLIDKKIRYRDGEMTSNSYRLSPSAYHSPSAQDALPSAQDALPPSAQDAPKEDTYIEEDISSNEGSSDVSEGPDAEQSESVEKEPTEHQKMFEAICHCVGWDYRIITKEQTGQVAQTLGKLKKAEYTIDDLREFYRWWHREDWRGKQGQLPTLTQLRAEIGKVKKGQNGHVDMGKGSKPYRGMEVLA